MNQGIEPRVRLTARDAHDRVLNVLRSYTARTAIDLSRTETLRIAVSQLGYTDLHLEAEPASHFPRISYGPDDLLRLGGILVVADEHLGPLEVRVRTELEA